MVLHLLALQFVFLIKGRNVIDLSCHPFGFRIDITVAPDVGISVIITQLVHLAN